MCVLSLTLYNPMDYSPPGSSVHGIFQARILEWLAISSFRISSQPRDQTCVSCISCTGRWILYHCATLGSWVYSNLNKSPEGEAITVWFFPQEFFPRFWKYLQHRYTVQRLPWMLMAYHTGTFALKSSLFKVLQKLFLVDLHKSGSRAGACQVRQPPGAQRIVY